VQIVCLDLEGVLVPEIWIEFSKRTGIPELMRTTRDEPDYDKLMTYRLNILRQHKLGLPDIQKVIAEMGPMRALAPSSTSCARITRSSSSPTRSTNLPTR
jgi:phosphoserine/homoserine phosphotransferase